MTELTLQQEKVWSFVRAYIQKERNSPTLREIMDHFGFRSVNGARVHVKALERKGLLEVRPKASRGIRLIQRADCIRTMANEQGEIVLELTDRIVRLNDEQATKVGNDLINLVRLTPEDRCPRSQSGGQQEAAIPADCQATIPD